MSSNKFSTPISAHNEQVICAAAAAAAAADYRNRDEKKVGENSEFSRKQNKWTCIRNGSSNRRHWLSIELPIAIVLCVSVNGGFDSGTVVHTCASILLTRRAHVCAVCVCVCLHQISTEKYAARETRRKIE